MKEILSAIAKLLTALGREDIKVEGKASKDQPPTVTFSNGVAELKVGFDDGFPDFDVDLKEQAIAGAVGTIVTSKLFK